MENPKDIHIRTIHKSYFSSVYPSVPIARKAHKDALHDLFHLPSSWRPLGTTSPRPAAPSQVPWNNARVAKLKGFGLSCATGVLVVLFLFLVVALFCFGL